MLNVKNARSQGNRVNNLINSSKATYIKDTLEANRDNPKKFWRILNETLLKGDNKSTNITLSTGNDGFTKTSGSCEYLNNYLVDIGVKLHDQFDHDTVDNAYQNIYNLESDNDDIVFTRDDLICSVHNIDVNKSSGIEFLPTFVLKDCFEVLIDQLTYLFNQSIALGTFPDCWKIASITPIPKTGDLSMVNNWRPISIIPLIGKMMEKLCNNILNNFFFFV